MQAQKKKSQRPTDQNRKARRTAEAAVHAKKAQAMVPKRRPVDRMHEAGMTGVDPRSERSQLASAVRQGVQAPGSTTTLKITVAVTDRAIAYLSMGIMLRALKNGSLTAQLSTEYPYYQWRYLIDVFTSVMQSGVIKLTAAPHWMWELLYALKPKIGSCKNGHVDYVWDIKDTAQGVDQAFALGTGPTAYSIFWGTFPSGFSVNGFPVLGPVPGVYTEEAGLSAIAALWPFITPQGEKLCADPGPSGVSTADDTSAFSVVYPELGESFFAQGGMRTTLYSERHIDSPILCQFGIYQPPGSTEWRGWHQSRLGAGSSSIVGPYMADNASSLKQVRNKPTPIIKFYNFDEFFEQLSLTLALAGEELVRAGQAAPLCPLTPQQVQILLRQVILQVCCNEYAQDIRLTGASFTDMLPFTVGPNGCLSGQSLNMLLPTFLAENIRAISKVTAKLSRVYDTNNVTWLPVLARPCESPQLGNYEALGAPVYSTDPSEVFVNLIDLSAAMNQSTVYLDVTRDEIGVLLNIWNEYITGLTAVLSPLVSVTSEHGIRALNCNMYTNVQEVLPPIIPPEPPVQVDAKQKKHSSSERPKRIGSDMTVLRKKVGATPVAGSSYMENVGERKITSGIGFDAVLEQIYSRWILPVNYSNDSIDDASTQGWQSFQIELATKNRSSSGGVGSNPNQAFRIPNALQRHLNAAVVDVKAFATTNQQNETIAALLELARLGRGGFLTSTISAIAGAFNPALGRTVKMVGDAIGL